MGGTPLSVNDGYTNTRIVANLPAPLPAAGDYLLVVTNTSNRLVGVLTVTIGGAGAQGPAGADGVSPVGQPEPAGANCQYGGLKYTDAQGAHYVCNGAPGSGNTTVLETRLLALERAAFPIVYITDYTNDRVLVMDAVSHTVVATVPVGNAPQGVAVNPAGTRAYVTNTNSFDVSVIDTSTHTVVATIPVGGVPLYVAFR
jgi:YVTN family beta-propeller protein